MLELINNGRSQVSIVIYDNEKERQAIFESKDEAGIGLIIPVRRVNND